MSVFGPRPVDRRPAIGTSPDRVFSCRLYRTGRDCRHCPAEQAHRLWHSLPSHGRRDADYCRRPQTPRSTNWFLCRSSHLGTEAASPSPPPLCRSRRRTVTRWQPLDFLQTGFLSLRARALSSVSSIVSEVSRRGLRLRPTPVLRLDPETARRPRVSLLYRSAEADRMVCLCQTAFCRAKTGAELRRPLYPSCGHFQQSFNRY